MISGCTQGTSNNTTIIPKDQFVFIEHHIHKVGEVIEGSPGFMFIDFPMYYFNSSDRSLEVHGSMNMDDNLTAIYGDGESLSGDAGSGAATYATGVYRLPYQSGDLTILNLNSDGTAYIQYKGLNLTLYPGQSWINETSTIEENQFYNTTLKMNETSKINMTVSDSIKNFGLCNKSKVKTH